MEFLASLPGFSSDLPVKTRVLDFQSGRAMDPVTPFRRLSKEWPVGQRGLMSVIEPS